MRELFRKEDMAEPEKLDLEFLNPPYPILEKVLEKVLIYKYEQKRIYKRPYGNGNFNRARSFGDLTF